jgi:hypothetical protein
MNFGILSAHLGCTGKKKRTPGECVSSIPQKTLFQIVSAWYIFNDNLTSSTSNLIAPIFLGAIKLEVEDVMSIVFQTKRVFLQLVV